MLSDAVSVRQSKRPIVRLTRDRTNASQRCKLNGISIDALIFVSTFGWAAERCMKVSFSLSRGINGHSIGRSQVWQDNGDDVSFRSVHVSFVCSRSRRQRRQHRSHILHYPLHVLYNFRLRIDATRRCVDERDRIELRIVRAECNCSSSAAGRRLLDSRARLTRRPMRNWCRGRNFTFDWCIQYSFFSFHFFLSSYS